MGTDALLSFATYLRRVRFDLDCLRLGLVRLIAPLERIAVPRPGDLACREAGKEKARSEVCMWVGG